ncbi:MAG TPA: GAF domain-containing protein [Thermoanaerobaculia bacterium]|nr:GAF domain-containing protein [Thermoanaerobaculia bacterium]
MTARNENPGGKTGGNYVQKVREDTNRAFTELNNQNGRLRVMVAALESDRSRLQVEKLRLQEQLMNVREELAQRTEEHATLMRRLSDVQHENESVAGRFVEIETQNTNLANLYVAGYQLHGSLDRQQVLVSIKEIVINLIGSEDFAIFERDGEDRLRMIDWFDEPPTVFHEVVIGEGIIGQVAATGQPFISNDDRGRSVGMVACVPLQVDGRVTGAIAIFRLLPQKHDGLELLDEELLGLLASQAGIALYCTGLHEQVIARQLAEAGR